MYTQFLASDLGLLTDWGQSFEKSLKQIVDGILQISNYLIDQGKDLFEFFSTLTTSMSSSGYFVLHAVPGALGAVFLTFFTITVLLRIIGRD